MITKEVQEIMDLVVKLEQDLTPNEFPPIRMKEVSLLRQEIIRLTNHLEAAQDYINVYR